MMNFEFYYIIISYKITGVIMRQAGNRNTVGDVKLFNLNDDPSEDRNLFGDSSYDWIVDDLLRDLRVHEQSSTGLIIVINYNETGTGQCIPELYGNGNVLTANPKFAAVFCVNS